MSWTKVKAARRNVLQVHPNPQFVHIISELLSFCWFLIVFFFPSLRASHVEYSISENSGSGRTQGKGSGMQQFMGKFPNFGRRLLKNGSCEVAEDEAGGQQLCSNFAASVKKTEE